MKLIFTRQDFVNLGFLSQEQPSHIALIANGIFDQWIKDNGTVVYAIDPRNWWANPDIPNPQKFKAILINIEKIGACTHPPASVKIMSDEDDIVAAFYCECGAKVKPREFEPV